jgi:putative glutamate/gamma-aminobutyrate antiporter
MATSPLSPNSTTPLKRTLGVFSLVMINVIAVDSLRSLPFSAVYGFSLVFYYILAGLVFFIPTALISAELATGWPNRGGVYVWVREAFGERWGFITIWLQWVYNVVWYPTILTFIGGVLAYLVDPQLADSKAYMLSVILIVFWGATLVNCFGMRLSSWVSTVCALMGTLIPMTFIIILGVIWMKQGNPLHITFTSQQFLPDLSDVNHLSFILVIVFGLVGMEMSASHADEVKNPSRSFPRAIVYSTVIIFFSLMLSSLAIAIVVPKDTLNIVTGLVQAYQIFFQNYNLTWLTPIMTLLIIIGGIGAVSAWIIGPTKGLLVATHDGSAPKVFGKVNKHGSPVVILLMQAILCTALCSVFLFMPTVSSSYWVLTAITAQLAMLVYVALFLAAIVLHHKKPHVKRAYRVPGGRAGIWLWSALGILSSLAVIALGFIPPSQLETGSLLKYETILVVGMVVLCLPPLVIYRMSLKARKTNGA